MTALSDPALDQFAQIGDGVKAMCHAAHVGDVALAESIRAALRRVGIDVTIRNPPTAPVACPVVRPVDRGDRR